MARETDEGACPPDGAALPQESFAAVHGAMNRAYALSGDPRLARVARAIDGVARHLGRPMRLAIMGEQNSGKSSLINTLLHESVAPAGALSGMRAHLLLRYGPEVALHAVGADGMRARLTSRALARMTAPEIHASAPGSAIIYNASDPAQRKAPGDFKPAGLLTLAPPSARDSAAKVIEIALPRAFLRRAELVESRLYPDHAEKSALRHAFQPMDLAVWCTLATQAWKETERQAWRRLPPRLRRNAILVVTYKDAVYKPNDQARLLHRLRHDAGAFFDDIILVSSRQALDAMSPLGEIADAAKWERSGAGVFEAALQTRLRVFQGRRLEKGAALLRRLSAEAGRHGNVGLPDGLAEIIAMHFHQLFDDIEKRLARQPENRFLTVQTQATG